MTNTCVPAGLFMVRGKATGLGYLIWEWLYGAMPHLGAFLGCLPVLDPAMLA